jgi:hypothetical protein
MCSDNRRPMVKKTTNRRVQDLESHLHLLEECVAKQEQDSDIWYKIISAELRVLVCKSGRNKPLLLDIIDEFKLVTKIRSSSPFGYITSEYVKRCKELNAPINHKEMGQQEMDFKKYIEEGCLGFHLNRVFTPKEFILMVSQKIGSSHEDVEVDADIPEIENLGDDWGGMSIIGANMHALGKSVLSVGISVLKVLKDGFGYKTRYFNNI